jgi:hypothetical protein
MRIRREGVQCAGLDAAGVRGIVVGFNSCSARLQAGSLEFSRCPPEGGRYKKGVNFEF